MHHWGTVNHVAYVIALKDSHKPKDSKWSEGPGGCFTNASRALQNNLAKIYNARNHIYGENFKLKLCMLAQSTALGTRTITKFQLENLIRGTISAMHKFQENILKSSWNVSETTPCHLIRSNLSKYCFCRYIPATVLGPEVVSLALCELSKIFS